MTLQEFTVHWTIEIEADTPVEAASQALAIQRDIESTALVFIVVDEDGDEHHEIDLYSGLRTAIVFADRRLSEGLEREATMLGCLARYRQGWMASIGTADGAWWVRYRGGGLPESVPMTEAESFLMRGVSRG